MDTLFRYAEAVGLHITMSAAEETGPHKEAGDPSLIPHEG